MKKHILVILGVCLMFPQTALSQWVYEDMLSYPSFNSQSLAGLSVVSVTMSIRVYSALNDISEEAASGSERASELSDLFDKRLNEYGLETALDQEFVIGCSVNGTRVIGGWVVDWHARLWKRHPIGSEAGLHNLLWESDGGRFHAQDWFPSEHVAHRCADEVIINWLRANRESQQAD